MDQERDPPRGGAGNGTQGRQIPFYRLDSNQSSSSIFEDVEMAHEEARVQPPKSPSRTFADMTQLFAGPIAESLPTSVSAFSHRRPRADSTASFTYYNDEDDIPEFDGSADLEEALFTDGEDDSVDLDDAASEDYILRRRSSTMSRGSIRAQLLRRDSIATTGSGHHLHRTTQKAYLANEDLTIAIAGFQTRRVGMMLYIALCVCTVGIAYLLFRWLPRWQIRLVGTPSSLVDCTWVVVEVCRIPRPQGD